MKLTRGINKIYLKKLVEWVTFAVLNGEREIGLTVVRPRARALDLVVVVGPRLALPLAPAGVHDARAPAALGAAGRHHRAPHLRLLLQAHLHIYHQSFESLNQEHNRKLSRFTLKRVYNCEIN